MLISRPHTARVSKLSLIDLAGSERALVRYNLLFSLLLILPFLPATFLTLLPAPVSLHACCCARIERVLNAAT